MLAMSPSPVLLSELARCLDHDDDPMRHQRSSFINNEWYMMKMMGSSEALIPDDHSHPHCHGQSSTDTATPIHDPKAAKKLNHNANERDRRKRINHLFSYLRSLLPQPHHHTKKMSIPATITHVLNYIPELQQLVQRLIRRKEQLLQNISSRAHPKYRKSGGSRRNLSSVSASRLGNGDVLVQMCSYKATLSGVLPVLEQDGLVLLNASSFESSGGSLFYSLHFKAGQTCRLECDQLTEKLLSL